MKVELFGKGWLGSEGLAVFSKPVATAVFYRDLLFLNGKRIKTNKPLKIIENIIKKKGIYGLGFISYDYKRYIFEEKIHKKPDIGLPLLFFLFYKGYEKKELENTKPAENRIDSILVPTDKKRFVKMVEKAKKYIREGDIYQINLSHRIQLKGFFNTDSIFRNLAVLQPAPYLMHIKTPYFSVVSGSMELFLEKKGGKLVSKPIKGTRKIGRTERETLMLARELESSPKERAENLMITDLMRNDIGRIARKGSVKVSSLFEVNRYTTLLQMESTVEGFLGKDTPFHRIVEAVFPAGSITGAPKRRAVEIIDTLESQRRELYCGATVLLKPDGDFVMSVAIRQSIFKNNSCFIYVGSGIVADSDPEMEYEETLLKAGANLKALGLDPNILRNHSF
ncbi:MAG: anthranilate synthase component I family protein [Aquificae bacterium]|nr:anthranilate synthase component I family protein [Aquificota bacterium]